MANYKTPGVYVEEISTLGSSIAGVPTAITGFVGYTESMTLPDGTSVFNKPVRITSLLEYQQIFGGPKKETFRVTLTGTAPSPTTVAVAAPSGGISEFIVFYQVQMFYANGGGTCYIVSVGDYNSTLDKDDLIAGTDQLEQIDEVTLLVVPEAVFIDNSSGDRKSIYDSMAAQCAKLQDRFSILDTVHISGNSIYEDAMDFRNNNIGANNLKYAAAYYPALNTTINYAYDDSQVVITDSRTSPVYSGTNNNTLFTINNGVTSTGSFTIGTNPTANTTTVSINSVVLHATEEFAVGATAAATAINLKNAINTIPALSSIVTAFMDPVTPAKVIVQAKLMGTAGNYTTTVGGTGITVSGTTLTGGVANSADKALYNTIKTELAKYRVALYPSATMAGTYASVDASRGVWKAPANVSLSFVGSPSIMITDEDQENLNVDSVSGKSINAIRVFTGRGTLVWGARTLAGNDNEWRYINVRRLFIYAEESVKKATEFVVFEANTANTWQRVKAMTEAFLTSIWRDGGLAGATTKDAYFVRVGLGITMTAQDILEGRMIVEIGMAAVRPAEFIILRFEHKLQES